MNLNAAAAARVAQIVEAAAALRVEVHSRRDGGRTLDCGVAARGGLEAGRQLAEVCLAGLGYVALTRGPSDVYPGPAVAVRTDAPVAACLAAQYAGWEIKTDDYFAMGSGPMRAAAAREPLFDKIGHRESAPEAVGVLEAAALPPDAVCRQLADKCGVEPARLTLLVAPTSSQAGTVQIVARSVETALHKLVELDFDVSRIESGWGIAPLPPVAGDDLTGIGRTNDAILYGGEVTLYVRTDDAVLEAVGPGVPSCASPDYGQPFLEIFERYGRDFYQIDPHLFSPAAIRFVNLESGRSFAFGRTDRDVLLRSFGT